MATQARSSDADYRPYASREPGNVGPAPTSAGVRAEQTTRETIQHAQDSASQAAENVREAAASRLGEQAGSQKERVAASLSGVAQALRQGEQELRGGEQASIAQYADQAANMVEGFAGYLRDSEVSDIVDDVEGLARRQPMLFIGAAFGIGLVAARFLKSSGRRAQERADQSQPAYRPGGYRPPTYAQSATASPGFGTSPGVSTPSPVRSYPTAGTTPSGVQATPSVSRPNPSFDRTSPPATGTRETLRQGQAAGYPASNTDPRVPSTRNADSVDDSSGRESRW